MQIIEYDKRLAASFPELGMNISVRDRVLALATIDEGELRVRSLMQCPNTFCFAPALPRLTRRSCASTLLNVSLNVCCAVSGSMMGGKRLLNGCAETQWR
jgi:hypothetical protein